MLVSVTVLEKECPHCNVAQGKVAACQKGLSVMLFLQNVLDIKDHVILLYKAVPTSLHKTTLYRQDTDHQRISALTYQLHLPTIKVSSRFSKVFIQGVLY